MGSVKKYAVMRLLFLLCLGRALGVVRSEVASDDEVLGRKSYALVDKHNPNAGDDKMIRRIEEEMLSLNKSGDFPRDKRALGILLQGFMEALGYTVAPFQIASLSNPTPAAQMPVPAAPPPAAGTMPRQQAPPPMSPPMTPNASTVTPPPRQRETLRFTGVLNFGDHSNTTNLVNHLAQYEKIFHGPPTPAAPPPAPAPNIDPRSNAPLPEPLFVKIPLPIAPNLPPPQPPSPMPIKSTYHDEFTRKDHEGEYNNSKDDEGHHGDYDEEDDKSHHREEYGNNHEQYKGKHDHYDDKPDEEYHEPENKIEKHDEPEDRIYEYKESEASYEKTNEPREKNTEKEYKKNENVVKYSVENKELHDPSEVSVEVPIVGNKYNHEIYVGEPDWKKDHEDHLYKLAAKQEAHAEALAEQNAERDNDRNREHELDEDVIEFHRSREKEIKDTNEEHAASYEANSKEKPYYDDDGEAAPDKDNYSDHRHHDQEDDYDQETKISEKPSSDSHRKETPTEVPKNTEKVTTSPATRRREESEEKSSKYNKNNDDYDQGKEKRRSYYTTLPIGYDQEKVRPDHTLRDSYGKSLEKPGEKLDERVAGYFTMFKNPQTGMYDPTFIQKYQNSRVPYDNDLVKGFKRIHKEYGSPESKYEEYEINDEDDDKVEHRSEKSRNPSSEDYEDKSENDSRKSSRKHFPKTLHTTECDCSTGKADVQSEEAKSLGRSVTNELPLRTVEAPDNYGPYYSTVKYLYEPRDYDQDIIARLTSYDPPTTRRFEDRTDLIFNPRHPSVERQQAIRPTEVGLPEKLTAKSLLHEAEAKEIRAWPAPFDYAFDNTEHNNVVLKGATQTTIKNSANNQAPIRQTPFETTRPCQFEALTQPSNQFTDKVQALLKDHENDNINNRQPRPQTTQGRGTKQNGRQTTRVNNHPTLHTTQATIIEQRKRLSSIERPVNYHERNRSPTYSPLTSETLTPYPERILIAKGSLDDRRNSRRRDQTTRQSTEYQEILKVKPTVKRKYSEHPPLSQGASKEESSNYVERDGMLIIPEPTPYFYNERVDEFTDEPQSETENVKIKEYRNRIASVKVAKLKRLHNESPLNARATIGT